MCPILHGGRKPVKVKKIKRGKRLGGSCESETFEAEVIVKKEGRKRTVKLAERHFFKGMSPREQGLYPLRDPIKQFEIMTELRHLNSKKKLGLHILPTIRLRKKILRKPTLLLTRYKELTVFEDLSSGQRAAVSAQQEKEKKILESVGYDIGIGAWKLIEDPFTGEPTYYLADFGSVRKIPKRNQK